MRARISFASALGILLANLAGSAVASGAEIIAPPVEESHSTIERPELPSLNSQIAEPASVPEDLRDNPKISRFLTQIVREKEFRKQRREWRALLLEIEQKRSAIAAHRSRLDALEKRHAAITEQLQKLPGAEDSANAAKATWEAAKEAASKLAKVSGQSDEDFSRAQQEARALEGFRQAQYEEQKSRFENLAKSQAEEKTVSTELEKQRKMYEKDNGRLEDLLEREYEMEDAIGLMLIPEQARNSFKWWVTVAFSLLVALVIAGFFVIAHRDASVRRAIFSNQSGIQFLTLFSVVIAIILFGITEILEGKELAALLGGLSGYILGRVSDRQVGTEATT